LLGKWVTQEEAYKSVKASTANVGQSSTSQITSQTKAPISDTSAPTIKGGPAPGRVVTKPLNPMRPIKCTPSASAAITANKRKREDNRPKAISKEEETALKAREAARKRMEEREKPLMGLYKSY
jgi:WW domain-binding protein 4